MVHDLADRVETLLSNPTAERTRRQSYRVNLYHAAEAEGHRDKGAAERSARDRRYNQFSRDPEATKFYHSALWITTRAAGLANNPICQRCRREWADVVHHRIELADCTPEQRIDHENLMPVCWACHAAIHALNRRDRRYKPGRRPACELRPERRLSPGGDQSFEPVAAFIFGRLRERNPGRADPAREPDQRTADEVAAIESSRAKKADRLPHGIR